ncbi:unnamed protein product [Rotaria magnacalcarata]|uniref:Methyltransferase type 11 domain-containing protein n=5 Tax=Rotaria magnacalcarata TaxID=392030 RepID=A0A815FHY5_9BILA|nr:unnamed protein product [Rotaria magnacalcarata]
MANSRNLMRTNVKSTSRSASTCDGFNISPINNVLMESSENQVDRRLTILENLLRDRLNEENVQVKQLKDRILKLEEQLEKQDIRIKILENQAMPLQSPDSKRVEVRSLIQTVVEENIEKQMESLTVEIPSVIRFEDDTARKTGIDLNKNGSDQILESESAGTRTVKQQLEDSDSKNNSNKTQLSTKLIDKSVLENNSKSETNVERNKSTPSSIVTSRSSEPNSLCSDCHPTLRHQRGAGTRVFTRWMNSRDDNLSLWASDQYRNQLLAYIGKIYGQERNIQYTLAPLRVESNESPELDQLFNVIKHFETQPGAKESLRRWQLEYRPGRRLTEIKAMFEYKQAGPSSLEGLKISSPSNVKEIINRTSIKAYFDMICRNGYITADIGEYLQLNKENIFGGTDYNIQNDRVTVVDVDLSQSTIKLADNRVDLITCFVTLHHVPEFEKMLADLNFVHAFMMIARVGEFGSIQRNHSEHNQVKSNHDLLTDSMDWSQQKANIIEYTNSIQYRTRTEWQQKLETVGFHLKATLDYDQNPKRNPQALYYAVFQLNAK